MKMIVALLAAGIVLGATDFAAADTGGGTRASLEGGAASLLKAISSSDQLRLADEPSTGATQNPQTEDGGGSDDGGGTNDGGSGDSGSGDSDSGGSGSGGSGTTSPP